MIDSQAESRPNNDIVKTAVDLIRSPEQKTRHPREIEDQLRARFGIEVRLKHQIKGRAVLYEDSIVRESANVRALTENCHWVTRPALETETENVEGYVYARPSQGRANSVTIAPIIDPETGEKYRFADIKGNGWGGFSRRLAKHMLREGQIDPTTYFYIDEGSDDMRGKEYGLLNKPEADAAVNQVKVNQGVHEKIIGFAVPETLPDDTGTNIPTNEALHKLGDDNFTPIFIMRLWHDPASIADIFYTANPIGELHFTPEWILNQPIFYNERNLWREHPKSMAIRNLVVGNFVHEFRRNAEPYIELMKQLYLEDCGTLPTDEQLFNSFTYCHLNNYRELIGRDSIHGALHMQNIRFGGEWGDSVTERKPRTEHRKRVERIKDFYDVYHAYVIMGLVYRATNLMTPIEFYQEALKNNPTVNSVHFPNIFPNFLYQDLYMEGVDVVKNLDIRRLDVSFISRRQVLVDVNRDLTSLFSLFKIQHSPISSELDFRIKLPIPVEQRPLPDDTYGIEKGTSTPLADFEDI